MPDRWLMMAWQAGAVFSLRSLQLWTEPASPRATLPPVTWAAMS